MKRIILIGLTTSLVLTALVSPAHATPSRGAACTQRGSVQGLPNQRFICTLVGKKMIWQVFTSSSAKNSAAENAPTANAKAPIPISLPIAQNGPITFQNIVSNISAIPQQAWQSVQSVIAANPAVSIPTTIHIGPTTKTTVDAITSILNREYRLWSGFTQPPAYYGIVFNATDVPWAEKDWATMASQNNFLQGVDAPASHFIDVLHTGCQMNGGVADVCYGGNSLVFAKNHSGFSFYGVQDNTSWNPGTTNGSMSQVAHEYTHNVQFAQWNTATFANTNSNGATAAHAVIPCWLQEGMANAIATPVFETTFEGYSSDRDYNVTRPINKNTPVAVSLKDFSVQSLTNFLANQDPASCYRPDISGDYQLGYSVGFATTEALVAIGGPQATLALYARVASGDSWPGAFQHVYGISWSAAAQVLGQVLAAEYAAKPMRTSN
jgi:hypothetical protein